MPSWEKPVFLSNRNLDDALRVRYALHFPDDPGNMTPRPLRCPFPPPFGTLFLDYGTDQRHRCPSMG
nr:MAG TPA: hypothetical protein [Bacteriophage sp.]